MVTCVVRLGELADVVDGVGCVSDEVGRSVTVAIDRLNVLHDVGACSLLEVFVVANGLYIQPLRWVAHPHPSPHVSGMTDSSLR